MGWTPETYIVASCTALERAGQVLEAESVSYLTAAYLLASGIVPYAYWYPVTSQARLDRNHLYFVYPSYGARAAVRVV